MSKLNHVFRTRPNINFTQVTNNVLQNPNLSFKAKGLYSYIQSYLLIPNFSLNKQFLINHCIEGEKAFNSAWKELKDAGFLKQYRIPNTEEKGKFIYEYELLIDADISTPGLINCDKDGNMIVKDNSEEQVIEENNHIPQNGSYGENDGPYTPKRTICSKDAMLKGVDNNNNTLNNNKDSNINKLSSSIEDEEEDNLKLVMKCCQKYNYKLSKEKAKAVLTIYNYDKVIKAITSIFTSGVTVKNPSAYLISVLKDMETTKVINFESNKSNSDINPKSFNNFEAREYDYDDLEAKLLGWDK